MYAYNIYIVLRVLVKFNHTTIVLTVRAIFSIGWALGKPETLGPLKGYFDKLPLPFLFSMKHLFWAISNIG